MKSLITKYYRISNSTMTDKSFYKGMNLDNEPIFVEVGRDGYYFKSKAAAKNIVVELINKFPNLRLSIEQHNVFRQSQ